MTTMEPIRLDNISSDFDYHRTDNRRKKQYGCTITYHVRLYGAGLQFLPMRRVLDNIEAAVPDEEATITCPGQTEGKNGIRLRASITFPAPRPKEILSEEEAIENTAPLHATLLKRELYQAYINETNEIREELADSYRPLLEKIQEKVEASEKRLVELAALLKKGLEEREVPGISRTLEWSVEDIGYYDRERFEWLKILHSLETSLKRGQEPLESLEYEVDSRVDNICWQNPHNSTSPYHNAFTHTEHKVHRKVLKDLRYVLSSFRRKAR
ncbi:MAG: hypothetical protein GF334_12825 [Candidatus Altiarchaeales archaeon]|nr:hypothetical protein [Candidatus Altiarchaeales archaeon]